MVTDLLRATTFDLMHATKAEDFTLLAGYPKAILEEVEKGPQDRLIADLREVAILLSEGSIIAHRETLKASENGFFLAFVRSLREMRECKPKAKTALADFLLSLHGAGEQSVEVFIRECQQLLLSVTGEDSPLVQVAAPQKIDTSSLPGIPSVTTVRSLLGGARVFHNGTLKDESWRARLTRILSVI